MGLSPLHSNVKENTNAGGLAWHHVPDCILLVKVK